MALTLGRGKDRAQADTSRASAHQPPPQSTVSFVQLFLIFSCLSIIHFYETATWPSIADSPLYPLGADDGDDERRKEGRDRDRFLEQVQERTRGVFDLCH